MIASIKTHIKKKTLLNISLKYEQKKITVNECRCDIKKENISSVIPTVATSNTTEDTKHFCTQCEMPFKSEKHLKSHIKSEHSEPQPETEKLKCSTCDATFRTSRMLRLHIYKNHTDNTKYSCQYCAEEYTDLKKFVLHQIKYHSERNGDEIFCLACRRPYTKSHRYVLEVPQGCEIYKT